MNASNTKPWPSQISDQLLKNFTYLSDLQYQYDCLGSQDQIEYMTSKLFAKFEKLFE